MNTNTPRQRPTTFSVRDGDEAARSLDNEPKIVEASAFKFPKIERPSIYSKYDGVMVGQAIVGVSPNVVNTIITRLKRKGMKLQAKKLDDDTYAIIRQG